MLIVPCKCCEMINSRTPFTISLFFGFVTNFAAFNKPSTRANRWVQPKAKFAPKPDSNLCHNTRLKPGAVFQLTSQRDKLIATSITKIGR